MSLDLGEIPDSEQKSEVSEMPKSEATKNTETKENVNSEPADTMPDTDLSEKSKALPEPIRIGKDIPRLPPINMAELTSILQGPNMPSKKLMKEVTEKIRMKNDESGSDDGSVSSGGVGIRGILDCILEVSLFHQDSDDDSDAEEDEIFVRELPCKFCKKIFGSTMNLKTHVLMTHSLEDPSVLNQCRDGKRKEKLSPGVRSRSMEGREKESTTRCRKRSSTGLQDSNVGKDEMSLREKRVLSRHNSKEPTPSSKETDSDKKEDKSCDSSCTPEATALDFKTTDKSSQKTTRQSSHEDDDAKKCDLKSSTPETSGKASHTDPEESSSLKAMKRKSKQVSSSTTDKSSPPKRARRSRNQSDKGIESSSNVTPRRSSRRK